MYVEPWIFWLILAPVAAVMALYLGYLALLLVGLLSITIGLGLSIGSDWLAAGAAWLMASSARAVTWVLGPLVAPFKPLGPWFDYVAATGVLAVLVGIAALLA